MFYRVFRAYVRVVLRVFFRSFDVSGEEHVPRQGPLLVVANHVNGLVDPLIAMVALERRVTLTAKNTLQKNPLLALLIWGLDIVLFHRAQDRGKGAELRENARSMARCQEILGAGGAVLLFPEGESHSDPGMRPFKPGAARIAAEWARRHPRGPALTVVPAGLYFTRKDRFRSGVALRFGPPLALASPTGAESRMGEAVRGVSDAAERAIKALALNLETEAQSQTLSWAAEILLARSKGPRLPGELVATAQDELDVKKALFDGWMALRAREAATVAALEVRIAAHRERLRSLRIDPAEARVEYTPARSALFVLRELEIAVVGAPWALLGAAGNALPYLAVDGIARLLSRDLDHWASHKIYPSLLVYPIFYLGEAAAVGALAGPLWAAGFLAAAPFAGLYAQLYRERMRDAARRARTFLALCRRPSEKAALVAEGDAIAAEIERLGRSLAGAREA